MNGSGPNGLGVCMSRRRRRKRHKEKNATRVTAARAPMTIPAAAPLERCPDVPVFSVSLDEECVRTAELVLVVLSGEPSNAASFDLSDESQTWVPERESGLTGKI